LPVWSINPGTTRWTGGIVSVDTVNKRVVLSGLLSADAVLVVR